MTVNDVLGRLDAETRKRATMAMDISPERQPTASVGLNEALNGGLGYGRIVTLWGTKSAGKTALALQTIGMAQRQGKVCALLDVEGTYEDEWGKRLGVQSDELIYFKNRAISKVSDTACDLIQAGTDIIVVDSVSAMAPSSYFDKKSEEFKGFESTGKIGADSQDLGKMLRAINLVNEDHNCLVILIAQGRMKQVSTMYWGLKPTGGESIRFYSSQVVKLQSADGDANFISGYTAINDQIVEAHIGRKVNYTVEFNKLGPQNRGGTYDFYYDGDFVGVDYTGELFDAALAKGLVEKAGTWYTWGSVRKQGRSAFIELLRENSEYVDLLRGEVESQTLTK